MLITLERCVSTFRKWRITIKSVLWDLQRKYALQELHLSCFDKKKKKLPPFTEFILLVLMYPKNQSKAIRITGEHYYRVLPLGEKKKKE